MLSFLSLVVVISLSLFYLIQSSSSHIDASTQSSMLVSLLPPSFLNTYSLSMSSRGFKALCFVFSFLSFGPFVEVLPSISNGPEYLTRGTAQMFISLMRSLLQSLVSRSFLVRLRYSLLVVFSFIATYLMCPLPVFPSTCNFPFRHAFWFFVEFGSSIPSVICLFSLLVISMAFFCTKFHSYIFTLYHHCLY